MQYTILDENSAQVKQDLRRLQTLRMQIVLWLIVIALGVLLIPLMLITGWVRTDVARLESDLLAVQSAMSRATTPNEEVVKISADIAQVNNLISVMQTVTVPSGVAWPLVIGAATQYDPATVQIGSLTQNSDRIQIAGRALNSDAVVGYQQNLLDAGVFKDVVVISMSTIPPTPVPTPDTKSNRNKSDTAAPAVPVVEPPFGNVEFVIDLLLSTIPAPGASTP
jgi:hypothetical protein